MGGSLGEQAGSSITISRTSDRGSMANLPNECSRSIGANCSRATNRFTTLSDYEHSLRYRASAINGKYNRYK